MQVFSPTHLCYSSGRTGAIRLALEGRLLYRGERDMEKVQIQRHTFMGTAWIAAWLFTIGFLHLDFWRGVLAVVLWPY
jgi:hypothetical protein